MKSDKDKQKILNQYEKDGEEIINKMLQILLRAQRKIDDVAYRKTLEKVEGDK